MNGQNISTDDQPGPFVTRRNLLKAGLYSTGALLLSGLGFYKYFLKPAKRFFPGRIVGASSSVGHLIRDNQLPTPSNTQIIETVIVGGGIAGLSSAWWMKRNGYDKFALLELEPEVGGNSQSAKNEITAYPWGAHYLPLPGPEAKYVHMLLEETGVIQGHDSKGLPIYNEYHLCADPHERLFIQGRWHEGIVPQIGLAEDDRRQYKDFFSFIEEQKIAEGRDGKRPFVVPVDLSSQDARFLALDQLSMAKFMEQHGWNSKYLVWYVNYCCRDDYGATYDKVSAWAGIHYFASRIGMGSNADSQTVLTWPEGNGWLVNKLRESANQQIKSNALVFSMADHADHVLVDYLDTITKQTFRIKARKVVFAAPRFVGARVIEGLKSSRPSYLKQLNYAPWMVANVSLRLAPQGNGAPLSWDNVSFYSPSLGYVVATHQSLSLFPKKTVLTYYQPLSDTDPVSARKQALSKTHQEWATLIADDLAKMHPGIINEIENIDVCLWGHGMIIPEVGFISGQSRKEMAKQLGHIHFAHSDMSGVSIFEEAQYHGVRAAMKVLDEIHRPQSRLS